MAEWQLALLVVLGGSVFLMVLGVPIYTALMATNIIGVYMFMGGSLGLTFLASSVFDVISMFALIPLVLFILMGELMYQSGVITKVLTALDKWIGRMPGRLSLLTVASGTVFATLTSNSLSGVALLGATLEPEMRKRGVHKSMILGPLAGGGCLAAMIPPAALAVLMGAIAKISVGKLLIAIIIPGLLLAFSYACYIIIRCMLNPTLAPPYEVDKIPLKEKLEDTVKHILPVAFVIFMVTGVIYFGICTPTEASATGAVSAVVLLLVYRTATKKNIEAALKSTVSISVMILCIIAGAQAFSQILAFTGASRHILEFAVNIPAPAIVTIIIMQLVILVMGMFLEVIPIMMLTIPIFLPIVKTLGFDPIWYAVIFLLNIEVSQITPPYALQLFVLKGVVSNDVTMMDIYKGVLPFLILDVICIGLILAFPDIALWLPSKF
jgi:tripartite ATP-independent transporter DctM subunit